MSDQADRFLQPFVEFWNGYLSNTDSATRKLLGNVGDIHRPHALNREQLDAISKVMDDYLRSAEFLNALRQSIDVIITAKKRLNDLERGESDQARMDRESALTVRPFAEAIPARPQTEWASMWNRFVDAASGAHTEGDDRFDAESYEVIYQAGSLRLLRFGDTQPAGPSVPVLICFSLVNRPHILDLRPNRSVIRQLVRQGLSVYLIDWGVPAAGDRTLRLCDYVCNRLKKMVDVVCAQSSTTQVSLLGYCMGGTMAAMFTSLFQQQVRNLILLATPVDFTGDESLLNVWTREEHFDVDGLIDVFGNCPGKLLQVCFQQTKPIQNYVEKYMNFHARRDDDVFLENFFSIERWANDSIPVAGETFREFTKMLYQRNLLVTGNMQLGGTPIDLGKITCPLLLLTADSDHLVPPSSTLALKNYVSSTEITEMSVDAGHIGVAVSSKAHQRLWPQAAAWLAAHSLSPDSV